MNEVGKMKKIFKVIFIILPLILATTGVIEFIHYLRGSGVTRNPYMSVLSAVVFYALAIRNILAFNKENE